MNDFTKNNETVTIVDHDTSFYNDDRFYDEFKFLSPAIENKIEYQIWIVKWIKDDQLF